MSDDADQVSPGAPGREASPADDGGLVVEGLEVRYGPSQALFGVSLEVKSGGALAVLGPNGAGKSTFGRAVSGLVPASAGHIRFAGKDIKGWAPHRIRRAGLTYIPEGRGIFPGLSVVDNLRMATRQLGGRVERQAGIDRAVEMFPVLGQRQQQRASSLSGGEQQMLALARALVVNPKLIIADEMSLGLAPLMVDQVFESLQTARESGIAVVLIEQFIHRALAFADHCVIFSRGLVGWSGPSSGAGQEVLDRYLGEAAAAASEGAAAVEIG
jgi:branched-chain amino acid transport system ATP-binding protein